jgi:NADH:ubiquinone oxidoreductase subunit H
MLPLFGIFFIASIAETNRAPFDLAEAESELVSGFMTEHAAGIFVFFFLAEYASIILMCILIAIVLLGGYNILSLMCISEDTIHFLLTSIFFILSVISLFIQFIVYIFTFIVNLLTLNIFNLYIDNIITNINNIIYGFSLEDFSLLTNKISLGVLLNIISLSILYILILGLKSCILIFTFI